MFLGFLCHKAFYIYRQSHPRRAHKQIKRLCETVAAKPGSSHLCRILSSWHQFKGTGTKSRIFEGLVSVAVRLGRPRTLAQEVELHIFRRLALRFRQHEQHEGHGDGAHGGIGEVDAVWGDGVDQIGLELSHQEGAKPVEAGKGRHLSTGPIQWKLYRPVLQTYKLKIIWSHKCCLFSIFLHVFPQFLATNGGNYFYDFF